MTHSQIAWLTVFWISLRIFGFWFSFFCKPMWFFQNIFLIYDSTLFNLLFVSLQHNSCVIRLLLIILIKFNWRYLCQLLWVFIDYFKLVFQFDGSFKGEEWYVFRAEDTINSVLHVKAIYIQAINEFAFLRLFYIFLNVFIMIFWWNALFAVLFESKLTEAGIECYFGNIVHFTIVNWFKKLVWSIERLLKFAL